MTIAPADLLQHARAFAVARHGAQTYGEGQPYVRHLDDVVRVLREDGERDEEVLAAGYLHDVVEDTATTAQALRDEGFPERTVALVLAVTNEPGRNRKEKAVRTYPRIRADERAVRLKLADRTANAEASQRDRDPRHEMYRKEAASFRAALHRPGEWETLWARLERAYERRP